MATRTIHATTTASGAGGRQGPGAYARRAGAVVGNKSGGAAQQGRVRE